ncbi:MAG TPA: hypothetical protein ENL08_05515, partial [Bacteroidetes bacterium]|nr:hypothetical protein [Bacteroidota bacterium]
MFFIKTRKTIAMTAVAALMLLTCHGGSHAQQAGYVEDLEPLYLVNTPTAGVLKKGQYMLDVEAYGNSGVRAGIAIGLFDRFMFGLSYGGEQLLGYGEPIWNELPGVLVKYRLMEESDALPAITLGYDMQ